jgi:hypothetical protein
MWEAQFVLWNFQAEFVASLPKFRWKVNHQYNIDNKYNVSSMYI